MEFIVDNIDKTRHFDVRNKTWEFISNTLYVSQERCIYMHTLKKEDNNSVHLRITKQLTELDIRNK